MACSCDLGMDPSQPVDETEKVEDGNKPAGCGLKEVHCIPYLLKEVCVEVPRKHRASYAEAETPAAGSSSKKQRMLGIDLLQFQRTFDENARLQSPIRSLESIKAIDNSEGKASGSYLMDCSNQVVTEEGESMSIKLPHASSETVLHADVQPYQCSQILTICCNGSLKHLQHPLVKSVDSNSRLDSPLARDSDEAARSVKPCFMKGCQVDGTATELVEITANGGVPCFSSEKGELLPAELLERLHPPKSEVSMQSANGISYVASEKLLPIMTSPPSADETSEARKLLLFQGDVTNEPRELESIMSAQKLSLTNGTLCEECEGLESMNSRCNLEKLMIQARRSPLPFTMAKSSLQSTVIEVDSKDMLNVRDVGNSGIDINKDSLSGQGEIIEMVILQEAENFPKDVTLHSTNEDSYRPGDSLDSQSVDEAPAEENVLSDAKAGEKTPAEENDLSDAKPDRFYCAKQGFNNETVQEDSCSVVDAPTDNSNCQSDAEDGPRNSTLCSLKDDRSSFSAALQIPSFNFLRSFFVGKANFTFEKHMESKRSEGDVRDDPLFLQEEHADSGCNLSNAMPSFDDPDTPIDSDISYNSQQSENLRPFPKKVDGNKDIYRGTKCLVSEKNYNGQEMAPAEMENSSSPEFQTSEQVETKKKLGTLKDTSGDICQNLPESVKEKRKRLMILAQIEKKGPPTSAKALLATGLLEGKYVRYMARGEVLRLGVIKDSGILCQCSDCKGQRVFNVSGFEKHAGSNARHPSDYIFLGNGKSLKEIIEAGIKVKETGDVLDTIQKVIEEGADRQVCVRCHKGGAILHCVSKSCSRFYHQECVGLHTFPEGKWLCPECLQIDIREPLLERKFLQRRSIHHPEFGLQLKPRDPSLHKALFLPGGLPDGTKLGYYDKGQCLLIGTKAGSGICCSCCNQVVSCSQFEVHAGWGARRNPLSIVFQSNEHQEILIRYMHRYNCIHLLDGMSLHDVAVQRGNVKSLECDDGPLTSVTGHDHCSKCGLDGELVHCGSCSRAYHLGCTGLHNSIDANWSCAHCITKKVTRLTKIQDSSSMAKDRVQGRCKRVVKAMESIASGCALCKCGDFTKLGFNERTVLLCDQCEKEFHVGCLKVHGMEDLKELPQGEWFCGKDCQHIHEILHLLVLNGPEPVPGSIASKVIAKLQQESQSGSADPTSFNLTWQILHGKRKSSQQGTVLDDVMDIFSECFDPIVDAVSGEDLIPLMVYSQTKGDQEFGGMHCIVLKFNEEVLSASIVRILGKQLAEMPLVATRLRRRSLGCCEALLQCVERLLGILQIRQILVPAAEGAEGIWLRKFGFSQMPHKQLQEFFSQFQMMVFSGSSVMQKAILSLPGIPENSKLE